jgi:DNA helicase HerA-like ATPase
VTDIITTLENTAGASGPLALLINDSCTAIGGIYRLDYSHAVVLTDDQRKYKAGGVPLGGFLLAAAGNSTEAGFVLDDEELILLRVRGTAPLPNEADLVMTRLAVVRDATTSGQPFDAVTDVLTRDELQQSAFDCEVIGTFYVEGGSVGDIAFGADIDNVVTSAKYQVFLPSEKVLSWLASYPETGDDDSLPLGHVRFSSTTRRARMSGLSNANVNVHISDFISRKTAVFGMTRTGKSNTIKTLVTAVYKYAARKQDLIGQLIFDPQGEYANVNKQDGTGLRLLGTEVGVRIYRFGADRSDPQILPLAMNFFDVSSLEAAAELVNSAVMQEYGSYAYVKTFTSINWSRPSDTDKSAYAAWNRAVVGLYGLLAMCGFSGDHLVDSEDEGRNVRFEFTWSNADWAEFEKSHPGMVSQRGTKYFLSSPEAAKQVTLFMKKKGTWNHASKDKDDERPFKHIVDVMDRASAKSVIRNLTGFHSAQTVDPVENLIWDDMVNGRLAIVDLSYGAGDFPRVISENIVTHLMNQANARFRTNRDPVKFQIIVEEAHNLFERGAKNVASNPWVRLSKEAAKYAIGLVYATQEVSSVDQRILSNTSNWLVAHLNSDNETRELSHYYDFKTWADSLRRCEDVGFVRMKTYSGKYIVPVQIARFDHSMINDARAAAGLLPVIQDDTGD